MKANRMGRGMHRLGIVLLVAWMCMGWEQPAQPAGAAKEELAPALADACKPSPLLKMYYKGGYVTRTDKFQIKIELDADWHGEDSGCQAPDCYGIRTMILLHVGNNCRVESASAVLTYFNDCGIDQLQQQEQIILNGSDCILKPPHPDLNAPGLKRLELRGRKGKILVRLERNRFYVKTGYDEAESSRLRLLQYEPDDTGTGNENTPNP